MTTVKGLPFSLPDRYKFKKKKVSGGQGAVYICVDTYLSRKVAIKRLHDSSDTESQIREITARAKIRSKHVVEIYDCWFDVNGNPTELVLEYVDGPTLNKARKKLKSHRSKIMALYQLACGIRDMHAVDVIHRDIKPNNMILDSSGVLKIYDLGLASVGVVDPSTLAAAGTLGFRAPELYQTTPVTYDSSVDVYAFGATAWFLFMGGLPSELLQIPPQNAGTVAPIEDAYPDLARVGPMINACLDLSPTARPTAISIASELHRVLAHDKHKASLTHRGRLHQITANNRQTKISATGVGSITLKYDGFDFVVRAISGDVFVNNTQLMPGEKISDSCVITIGGDERGAARAFFSINVSKPEIVL